MRSTVPIPRRRSVLLAGLLALGVWLSTTASALAATTCTSEMSGQLSGPLDVPAGAGCTLDATAVVVGATTVEGTLDAPQSVTFEGGITANRAGALDIANSTIEGAMTLTGGTGAINLSGDTIEGPATIDANRANINIEGDTFTSSLSCQGNNPAPNDGAASTIEGGASGQCTGFNGPGTGNPGPTPTPTPQRVVPPIKLPGFYYVPVLNKGALVLRWRCLAATAGACDETVHIVISDQGHRLSLGNHRVNLAGGHRRTWMLKLSRAWRARLRNHRGHLTITVGTRTIYSGPIIA